MTFSTTVIPAHTRVEGRVETPADLTVEGRCDGELAVGGKVSVAASATACADIRARTALVHGEVIGNIVCTDAIVVAAGARVVGDLRAPDIAVDPAAEVDGRVDLLPPAPSGEVHKTPIRAHLARPAAPGGPRELAAAAERVAELEVETPTVDERPPAGLARRQIPRPPRPRGKNRVVTARAGKGPADGE